VVIDTDYIGSHKSNYHTITTKLVKNTSYSLINDIWDGCSQQDSDNLEKLQIEAGRIVTGLPLFASRQSIYSETGWELLSDRRRVRRLSLFYSIHNQSAPDYLCDLMPLPVGSVSQYNLKMVVKFCTKLSFTVF
jgi:hypothetical protein